MTEEELEKTAKEPAKPIDYFIDMEEEEAQAILHLQKKYGMDVVRSD